MDISLKNQCLNIIASPMTRHGRRSGLSASAREDEIRLKDLLNEFQNLEESEVKTLFSTFVNSQDLQGCLIRFLSRHRLLDNGESSQDQDLEILRKVCTMLLSFYRGMVTMASKPKLASTANDLAKNRPVVFQYLPHLMAIHLSAAQIAEEKRSHKFLDAFFLAIYNSEAISTHQPLQQQNTLSEAVRVPGLSQSSIFHESSRLDAETIEKLNRTLGNSFVILEPSFRQIRTINASTRYYIMQLLWRTFNRHLPDISKSSIDQIGNVSLQLLSTSTDRRIFLPSQVLMEVLFLSYFCIYNGFQILGTQLLGQIEDRASANAWPSVLMVSASIKRLSITCGPSQSSFISSTPGQLAKHMITNASFRAKKISDDIPKVLGDENVDRMKMISEETPTEENQGELIQVQSSTKSLKGQTNGGDNSASKVYTSNKEKLMAKLPNLKVSISGKRDKYFSENADSSLTPDGKRGDKSSQSEKNKSDKKKSGKIHIGLAPGHGTNNPSSPSPTSVSSGINFSKSQNGEGFSINSKNIESLEQVEELIQMKKLPPETISIHSPESGTTLF